MHQAHQQYLQEQMAHLPDLFAEIFNIGPRPYPKYTVSWLLNEYINDNIQPMTPIPLGPIHGQF